MKTKSIFQGDSFGSTFAHLMILDPNHPNNTQATIPGYSKSKKYPESPDKEYVFEKMLERVWSNWLIDGRALVIEVYYRPDKRYTWESAHQLVSLERKDYRIVSQELVTVRMQQALDLHYTAIRKGEKAPSDARSIYSGRDYLKILEHLLRCKAFATREELTSYCIARIAEKKPAGILDDFKRRYEQKWFNDGSADDEQSLPASPKPVTPKPDQMNGLVNKLINNFNPNSHKK